MRLGIEGRIALVLGAGGGLGRAIASSLAAEGVHVAAAGRTLESVERTASVVAEKGVKSLSLEWNLSDLAAIDPGISRVESELGPVDILINLTGGPPPTPTTGQDAGVWRSHFESMVLSVIATTDRVLPGMRQRGWGRIITSTSSGVVSPIAGLAISNALRMSLVGWSKTLAGEIGRDGITANIVVPGRIATPRVDSLDSIRAAARGQTAEEVARSSAEPIPIGRYGTPEEYGDVVTFLASARSSYITGSVIRVDGGMIPGA